MGLRVKITPGMFGTDRNLVQIGRALVQLSDENDELRKEIDELKDKFKLIEPILIEKQKQIELEAQQAIDKQKADIELKINQPDLIEILPEKYVKYGFWSCSKFEHKIIRSFIFHSSPPSVTISCKDYSDESKVIEIYNILNDYIQLYKLPYKVKYNNKDRYGEISSTDYSISIDCVRRYVDERNWNPFNKIFGQMLSLIGFKLITPN